MRILFLTPEPPLPANKGTAMRNAAMLRFARAAGFEICLVSGIAMGREVEPALRELCADLVAVPIHQLSPMARIAAAFGSGPDLQQPYDRSTLRDAVRKAIQRFGPDVVQVEGLELGGLIREVRRPGRAVVFDAHNCETSLAATLAKVRPVFTAKGLWTRMQLPRIRRAEIRAVIEADVVLAVSPTDAGALRALAPAAEIRVVPNPIDAEPLRGLDRRPAEPPRLLFTGTMDYAPNVEAVTWFVREVLALVPETYLDVVGRAPAPEVLGLAGPRVTVTGEVESVDPFLARASAFVVPLHAGGGSRLKVLQAMAAGVPLVSTSNGMLGIDARPGEHYLRADEAAGFAAAIRDVLADRGAAEARAAAARSLVSGAYGLEAVGIRWRAAIDAVTSAGG